MVFDLWGRRRCGVFICKLIWIFKELLCLISIRYWVVVFCGVFYGDVGLVEVNWVVDGKCEYV